MLPLNYRMVVATTTTRTTIMTMVKLEPHSPSTIIIITQPKFPEADTHYAIPWRIDG